MAARLNTRFVLILSIAAVVIVGGGIAGYMMVTKSGDYWVRVALQAEAEGDWEAAVRAWERAVGHEHANVEWLRGWQKAYSNIVPESRQRAEEAFMELRAIRGALASARPDDPEMQLEWIEAQFAIHERMGAEVQGWMSLADNVDDVLRYIGDPRDRGYDADSEEEVAYCRLLRYRAIARVEQIRRIEMPPLAILEAREDLERCMRAIPDDPLIAITLADWYSIEAQRLLAQHQPAEARKARMQSTEVLEEFVETNPDDPEGLIALAIQLQRDQHQWSNTGQSPERAQESLTRARERSIDYFRRAEERLRTDFDRRAAALLTSVESIGVLSTLEPRNTAIERVIELIDLGLRERRTDTAFLFRKSELLWALGRFDETIATLEQIAAMPTPVAGLDGYLIFMERPAAVVQMFNVSMAQWRQMADSQERQSTLDRAKELREQYLGYVSSPDEDPSMWLIDGQLAHARGNHGEAIRLLQQARTARGRLDPRAEYVLADSLRRRGQTGDAEPILRGIYEAISPFDPQWTVVFSTLIDTQRQLDMGAAACETIEQALRFYDPTSEPARQLMILHQQLARQHGLTSRLGMFDVQAWLDPRQEAIQAVAAAIRDGKPPREVEPSVLQLAASHPDDLQVMELKASFYEGAGPAYTEKAIAAWRKVLQLDPAHAAAPLRLRVLEGEDPLQVAVDAIERNEQLSEVERQVMYWRLYQQTGHQDLAAQAAERAQELDSSHPDVVEILFTTALAERDWPAAGRYVGSARRLNLDQANGALFEARLQRAQGDFQAAITTLNRAIERNPLLAEAYRLRGQTHYDVGNLSACIADLDRALSSQPTDLRIIRMLATALRQRGGEEEARALELVRAARRHAQHDPELARIWRELESSIGDADAVTRDLRLSHERDPTNIELARQYADHLIRARDFETASAIISTIEAQIPNEISTLHLRAVWHAEQGGPEGVEAGQAVYVRLIESLDPQDRTSAHYLALGSFLARYGRQGEAVEWLKRGLDEQDSNLRDIDATLAGIYFQAGRFEMAIEHLQAALDEGTDMPEAQADQLRAMLIESNIELGRTQEARRLLERDMSRTQPQMQHYLLEFRIHEANDDAARARQALDRAVAAEPSNHIGYFRRAMFNRRDRAMRSDVLADLARALEIRPNFLPARELRMDIYAAEGDFAQALVEQGKIVGFDPRNKELRRSYAQNLGLAGQTEQQLGILMKGAELFPDDPDWHVDIARWKRANNDITGAQESARKAYDISERNPYIGLIYADLLLRPGARKDPELVHHLLNRHDEQLRMFPDYHLIRARCYRELGRMSDAAASMRAAWQQVGRTEPEHRPHAMTQWASALTELHPRDLDAMLRLAHEVVGERIPAEIALVVIEHASRRVPGVSDRLVSLAMPIIDDTQATMRARVMAGSLAALLHVRENQYEEAVSLYKRVLDDLIGPVSDEEKRAFASTRLECLNNLAFILTRFLGRPADAEAYAREAAQLSPQNADVLDTWGLVQLRLGKVDAAIATLHQSLSIEQKGANLLHMAEAQVAAREYAEAWTYIRRAERRIAPHETDYLEQLERMKEELRRAEAGGA